MDSDGLVCDCCRLSEERLTFKAKNERDMIAHLQEHRRAGHMIPQEAFDELQSTISN
jgi:hypothetical protein